MEVNDSIFYNFGKKLAFKVNEFINPNDNVIIASSNEDADFFTKGLIESLSTTNISLSVFWFKHIIVNDDLNIKINPITMSYEEPFNKCDSLIMVKSYVDSTDEIEETLLRLYSKAKPKNVYLLSPIIFDNILDDTFKITYKLKVINLDIVDKEKATQSIKEFLKNKKDENKIPNIVKERTKNI